MHLNKNVLDERGVLVKRRTTQRFVAAGNMPDRKETIRSLLSLIGAMLIASCSTTPAIQPSPADSAGLVRDPVLGVADTRTRCTIPAMMDIWHRRASERLEDFPIGPGDEITITVPEIEELQNQRVRILQDGTIALPLIGTVRLGGLNEDEARAAILVRLAKFMKVPRLEMYVDRYRSRGVALAGAVPKPGVYDLASFDDSLNDMIVLAGGLAPSAAQTAIFLPAGMADYSTTMPADPPDVATEVTPVSTAAPDEQTYRSMLARHISIAIPLGRSGDVGCLNMPARPGDIILIPDAGNITVIGWVHNPGTYQISPGMTVLGAVTAAGGALFSWHAEVLRTDQTGSRVIKQFNLRRLESGTEADIPLEAGDVVLVEKSVVGAVPYALWAIFQHSGSGVGMGIPVP
jgi:polysaccharide export outer membrane protein